MMEPTVPPSPGIARVATTPAHTVSRERGEVCPSGLECEKIHSLGPNTFETVKGEQKKIYGQNDLLGLARIVSGPMTADARDRLRLDVHDAVLEVCSNDSYKTRLLTLRAVSLYETLYEKYRVEYCPYALVKALLGGVNLLPTGRSTDQYDRRRSATMPAPDILTAEATSSGHSEVVMEVPFLDSGMMEEEPDDMDCEKSSPPVAKLGAFHQKPIAAYLEGGTKKDTHAVSDEALAVKKEVEDLDVGNNTTDKFRALMLQPKDLTQNMWMKTIGWTCAVLVSVCGIYYAGKVDCLASVMECVRGRASDHRI